MEGFINGAGDVYAAIQGDISFSDVTEKFTNMLKNVERTGSTGKYVGIKVYRF